MNIVLLTYCSGGPKMDDPPPPREGGGLKVSKRNFWLVWKSNKSTKNIQNVQNDSVIMNIVFSIANNILFWGPKNEWPQKEGGGPKVIKKFRPF